MFDLASISKLLTLIDYIYKAFQSSGEKRIYMPYGLYAL